MQKEHILRTKIRWNSIVQKTAAKERKTNSIAVEPDIRSVSDGAIKGSTNGTSSVENLSKKIRNWNSSQWACHTSLSPRARYQCIAKDIDLV